MLGPVAQAAGELTRFISLAKMAVDVFTVYLATAVVVFAIIIVVTLINKFNDGKIDH